MPFGALRDGLTVLIWAIFAQVTRSIQLSQVSTAVPNSKNASKLIKARGGKNGTKRGPKDCGDDVYLNVDNLRDEEKIPVFAFDKDAHSHMQTMVLDWANLYESKVDVALHACLGRRTVRKAFQLIEYTKPKAILWLLPFNNGDREHILPEFARFFEKSHNSTRHGVFYWPPEACGAAGCTADAVQAAFKHTKFVFQFAYQDERLSRADPDNYLPWPLGPAWWKGWRTPMSPAPPSQRQYLAVFRGALNTHSGIEGLKGAVDGIEGVVVEDSGKWIGVDSEASARRYRELLSGSRYAINIPGRNPNCYRIVESVLSGAIPIIFVREGQHDCYDNWAAVYGNPIHTKWDWIPRSPFEVVGSMEELPTRLHDYSLTELDDARQVELDSWYRTWRQSFRVKLMTKLELLVKS